MKIVLEKKDIRNIELEDFTFRDYGGLSAGIIFYVDDEYELLDEEDKITIEIEGTYRNEGIHTGGSGWFSGKLIIYKDDELFSELEEGKIFADFIKLDCNAGGGDSFKVNTSEPLSYNISSFIYDEHETFYDIEYSAFNWIEFLDNKDLISKLIPELEKIFPDESIKSISEDAENLVNFLDEKGIISNDDIEPEFNADYDNTLGKIMFPYFKKEFDGYVIENEDGGFSISGEPGRKDKNSGVNINDVYIYLK